MKYALIFLYCFGISYQAFSQSSLIRPKPEPAVFVNDYTEVLSRAELQQLEEKLRQFDRTTSNQLAIVILPSLEGSNLEILANEWFKAWGIGQRDKNNGLLILIAVKDRKMRIEVGYGLNNIITHIEAQKVIENQLKPNFRNNQFFKGLDEATTYLMGLAIQKFPPQANNSSATTYDSSYVLGNSQDNDSTWIYTISLVLIFCIVAFAIVKVFHAKKATRNYSQNNFSSYQKRETTSKSDYHKSNTDYTSTYYYYSNSYTPSNDSNSSSSDSDSSYGGGDSGGDGASGDW